MLLDTKKTAIFISILAVFLFIADRILKYHALKTAVNISLLGDFLEYNFVPNYFIAFSIPFAGPLLYLFIAIILMFLILYLVRLLMIERWLESSLVFSIVVGSVSNVLDRLRFGFVVDYIDLEYFTVFNIADSMIVIAAFVLAIITLKNENAERPPSR